MPQYVPQEQINREIRRKNRQQRDKAFFAKTREQHQQREMERAQRMAQQEQICRIKKAQKPKATWGNRCW
jgi:hypothetical protein